MKTSNLNKSAALFDLKTALKKALFPALILLIVITGLSPLSFFTGSGAKYPLLSEDILPSGDQVSRYGTEKVPTFFFLFDDNGLAYGLFFFTLGIGIWIALRQFGFLNNRIKTNVVLSCGLSRRRLFINRCSASLIMLASAFIVPLTVTLFANLARLGIHGYIFSAYFLFIVSFFAAALIGFTAGTLGAVLSGTPWEAAIGSVSLLLIPTETVLLIQYCFNVFLKGYPGFYTGKKGFFPISDYFLNIEYATVLYKLKWLNPLLLLYNPYSFENITYSRNLWSVYSQHEKGYFLSSALDGIAQHILPFAAWILASVLVLFFINRLFLRRKAEIGGFYGKSKAMGAVLITAAAIFAAGWGLCDAVFMTSDGGGITYSSLDGKGRLQCLLTILLYTFLAVAVCLLFWYRDIKKWRKIVKLLPLSLLSVLVPLCCLLGGFGYVSYIPDAQNVDKILIDMPFGVTPLTLSFDEARFVSYGGFTDDSGKQTVLALHRQLITDTDRSANTWRNRIYYKLKSGRTVSRYYTACSTETLKQFISLYDTKTVKDVMRTQFCDKQPRIAFDAEYAYMQSKDYAGYDPFTYANYYYTQEWLNFENVTVSLRPAAGSLKTDVTSKLSAERYDKLIACLADDYRVMTGGEFYTPAAPPLGVVSILCTYEKSEAIYELPVYREMALTAAYLKTLGVSSAFYKDFSIKSIALYDCSATRFFRGESAAANPKERIAQYEGEKTVSPTAVYTDKADIKEMTGRLYPLYLTVGENVSYAAVTYTDGTEALYIIKN